MGLFDLRGDTTIYGTSKPVNTELYYGNLPTGVSAADATKTALNSVISRTGIEIKDPGKIDVIYNWANSQGDFVTIGHKYLGAVSQLQDDIAVYKTASETDVNNIFEVITKYLPGKLAIPDTIKGSFTRYFPFHFDATLKIPGAKVLTISGMTKFYIGVGVAVIVAIIIMFYMAKNKV